MASAVEDSGGGPPPLPMEEINHRTVVGQHRRARTRERIIEAAARVYAEKGSDSPVIDDFVKAAGMSRGTFYNHFMTTSELMEATVEWFEIQLAETIFGVILHYPDMVLKSAMAMRLHMHWVTSDPILCALVARVPKVAEVGVREARLLLRDGVAAGIFKVVDFDVACDMVFGTMHESIRRIARSPDEPKRLNEVVSVVLLALGVSPARIAESMALPMPAVPAPVRLSDRRLGR